MFTEELGIEMGETTLDNLFTLQYTSCVGACDLAPVAKIGEKVYGHLTREKVAQIIKSYREGTRCLK
jgi:NADH-quinone oxidoreductase subunit E